MHKTTLPTGIIGCIEIHITTVKELHGRLNDIITLIRSVGHNYYPDEIEPNNGYCQEMKQKTLIPMLII